MILENFKIKKFRAEPTEILRLFLAVVFLSAGIFRIFNPGAATEEFSALRLPLFLAPLMIIFEIIAGLLLLFNRFTKQVYYGLIMFMIIVLGWSFILSGGTLIREAGELFVFNLNPTDFFLHFVFLIIAIVLLIRMKQSRG
ncbi:MAG: DoxX family protein [Patescibacteria group bacterium]